MHQGYCHRKGKMTGQALLVVGRQEVEEQPEEAETRRRSRCTNLRSNARGKEGKHAGRGFERRWRGKLIWYGRRPMADCSLVTMP